MNPTCEAIGFQSSGPGVDLVIIEKMAIAVSIFGVSFAAFCVWLVVRIANRRERWAKRTAFAVLLATALYVISFGPACWISSRLNTGERLVGFTYRPITCLLTNGQSPVSNALDGYSRLAAASGWAWCRYFNADGTETDWEWGYCSYSF